MAFSVWSYCVSEIQLDKRPEYYLRWTFPVSFWGDEELVIREGRMSAGKLEVAESFSDAREITEP